LEGGEAMLATAAAVIASPDAVRYPFGDVMLKVLFSFIEVIQALSHCCHTIEVLARICADSKVETSGEESARGWPGAHPFGSKH
jgi:hypothetical protein